MSSKLGQPTRRALVTAAGLGVGAGLLAPAAGLAQTTRPAGSAEIWSAEYTAKAGDVPQARGRTQGRRGGASGAAAGARLVAVLAADLRPDGAEPRRVFRDEH